jgi:hypothetical protein
MGDKAFPISTKDVLRLSRGIGKAVSRTARGMLGDCAMIRHDPDLQRVVDTAIDTEFGKRPKQPCWLRGFCPRTCSVGLVTAAHAYFQRLLLDTFGHTACRSGDLMVQLRGVPHPSDGSAASLQLFGLVTCQSLSPRKSLLTMVVVIDGVPHGSPYVYPLEPHLPARVEVVSSVSQRWIFKMSTTLIVELLRLGLNWHMSAINYKHESQNVLMLQSARGDAQPVLSKDGPYHTVAVDALDEVVDEALFDDDADLFAEEMSGMLADMRGRLPEEPPLPPPPAPPVLPPIIELPPTPELTIRNNTVFLPGAARPIGRITLMVSWTHPSFAMRCLTHGASCSLTADCTDEGMVALKQWVAAAGLYRDSIQHRAAKPATCRAHAILPLR